MDWVYEAGASGAVSFFTVCLQGLTYDAHSWVIVPSLGLSANSCAS